MFTIYEPNKYLKQGIFIWKDMVKEIIEKRELIWRLFLRNLSTRYKQSVLGIIWIVSIPFVAIATFIILNRAGIIYLEQTAIPFILSTFPLTALVLLLLTALEIFTFMDFLEVIQARNS